MAGDGKKNPHKVLRLLFWLASSAMFFFGIVTAVAYIWVTRKFETANLNMILIYLDLPLTGVDIQYIASLIAYLIFAAAATVVYALLFCKSYAHHTLLGIRTPFWRIAMVCATAILFLGSLSAIEKKYHLYDNIFPDANYYSYVDDNIFIPDIDAIVFPKEKRNLIFIILESVETSICEQNDSASALMPALGRLMEENLSFTGYRATIGTESSVLSFYTTNVGLPVLYYPLGLFTINPVTKEWELVNARTRAKKDVVHDFRKRSLLGILESAGYNLKLFRAASIQFAGYNQIFSMSCDTIEICDFDFIQKAKTDYKDRINNWGVDDSYLYEQAKQSLEKSHETPFALLIQTVNTHPPGYYEKDMPRVWNDFRDSFSQADVLLSRFLAWVSQQPFADNTTIVVVGDHLLSTRELGALTLPPVSKGEIVFMCVNPAPRKIERGTRRTYTTFDLGPTILEALGAEIPGRRLGLGTSLFSGQDTLLERDGYEKYTEMIQKRSRLYETSYLW